MNENDKFFKVQFAKSNETAEAKFESLLAEQPELAEYIKNTATDPDAWLWIFKIGYADGMVEGQRIAEAIATEAVRQADA